MRFTLVTPVWNGMPWLPGCVRSIDAQRGDVDIEHIVLDAGSTDGTREWLHANAPNAVLIFEKDAGQVDALRKGFARASGDVLGWLNADDVLAPGALARVHRAFVEHPGAQLVSGACDLVDELGRSLGQLAPPAHVDLATLVRRVRGLPQPATFFTRSGYTKTGFRDGYRLIFDSDLFRRIAELGPVVTLPRDALATFLVRKESLSGSNPPLAAREDLASRRGQGLPLASFAAVVLAARGYVYPHVPPVLVEAARRAKRRLGVVG